MTTESECECMFLVDLSTEREQLERDPSLSMSGQRARERCIQHIHYGCIRVMAFLSLSLSLYSRKLHPLPLS